MFANHSTIWLHDNKQWLANRIWELCIIVTAVERPSSINMPDILSHLACPNNFLMTHGDIFRYYRERKRWRQVLPLFHNFAHTLSLEKLIGCIFGRIRSLKFRKSSGSALAEACAVCVLLFRRVLNTFCGFETPKQQRLGLPGSCRNSESAHTQHLSYFAVYPSAQP